MIFSLPYTLALGRCVRVTPRCDLINDNAVDYIEKVAARDSIISAFNYAGDVCYCAVSNHIVPAKYAP